MIGRRSSRQCLAGSPNASRGLRRTLTEARDEKTLTLLHRRLRRVDLLMFVPFARAGGELLFGLLSGAWGVKVSLSSKVLSILSSRRSWPYRFRPSTLTRRRASLLSSLQLLEARVLCSWFIRARFSFLVFFLVLASLRLSFSIRL